MINKGEQKLELVERGAAPRRKACLFCRDKKGVDYKDVPTLKGYLTERGKIMPVRFSGNCSKHQRAMTIAVKRARHIALLPFFNER